MEFSFIHTADIHLGRAFADIDYELTADQKEILKSAHEDAFRNLCKFAIEHNVDFILIAGDTFDDCEHDLHSRLILISELRKLDAHGIDTYIICGNHDPSYSYTNELAFKDSEKIRIFGVNSETKPTIIYKNNQPIAQIFPFGFKTNEYKDSPCQALEKATSKNIFNIGLIHCDTLGDKNSYAPCTEKELLELDYDYYALGHIHKPCEHGKIVYSGTIQARSKKDEGEHGFKHIIVKNNQIVENNFISCDNVRYYNIEYNISEDNNPTETVEKINEIITEIKKDISLAIISITLKGICKYKKTDLDDFKQELTSSDVIINEFIDKSSFNSDRNDILTNGGILARILLNTANKSELDEILKKTKEELRETLKLVDDINDNDIIPAAITLAETTCGEIYGRSDDCE